MEASSDCCIASGGGEEDTENSYLKRRDQKDIHVDEAKSKKSRCLDKHVLQFQPTSDSICIFRTLEHFKVGGFYEIEHSQLPPNSPVQIKCISVVMVSDKGVHQVSLRYPSLHSLRTYFSDQNFDMPSGKKIPALDEKYAMGLEFAIKALCRSIPTEEFAQKRNSWNFWVSPSNENIKNIDNPVIGDAATSLLSKQGSCWSQLKFTGMMQWGQRRQVQFLGRHEYQKVESLPELCKGKGVTVEHREAINEKKRKKFEEDKDVAIKIASCEVPMMTRQCKMSHQNVGSSSGVKNSEKVMNDTKKLKLVVSSKNKRKITIDRWCADRYKLAEVNMLKVMKEKEAVFGNPILRPDLRTEARKYIGDTGLLDHLLKHMAGKVAPGGAERFRRRHNAEGAMEYWLESADLADVRKEAGVQDPYWTPPPGWKPGDSTSPDHINSRELKEMKEEIHKLKYAMRELASKREEEALAIVTTPSSCLSSLNSEDYGSLVSKQEIYADLVIKKAKIEEQLKEICLALSGMEEQMRMLKPTVVEEEPKMSELVTPQALLEGPKSSLGEKIGEETKEEEKKNSNDNKATKSAETQMVGNTAAAEDKAAKIERLKSGFIICKPKGSFMWPDISLSPHVVTNLEENTVVPIKTPSSASSSTQNLPLLPPYPSSPVKPQAERRPVSTATLTTIVTGPFSPHLSQPTGTPTSTVTDTSTKEFHFI